MCGIRLCEICGRSVGHSYRCPNYTPPKASYYCSACGDEIYDGEEYIENLDGEYRHYECFYGMRDLLEWLGYKIKTMQNTT